MFCHLKICIFLYTVHAALYDLLRIKRYYVQNKDETMLKLLQYDAHINQIDFTKI